MKSEKKPQKFTWPYIYLLKEEKLTKFFWRPEKKNFANIKCRKALRTVKITWVKSSKL